MFANSGYLYLHPGLGRLDQEIEALRADPSSLEVAARLASRAEELGAWDEYAEARAEQAAVLSTQAPEAAVDAWLALALAREEQLDDLAGAADAYQEILNLEPQHRRALYALGLLLHDLERWDDLIEVYEVRISGSADAGEQTTLHMYLAEVLHDRKNDPKAAFDALLAAARLAPQNLRIITRLSELGEETDQLQEVAVAIGDLLLNQTDPRLRAALSLRLAQLHLGPLDDRARALTYLRSALADDGGNPEILQEIEDVFRERDRFDDLAELLEETIQDRRTGPHRVRLERELARLYEYELNDPERAIQALSRAVDHAPDDRELLDEVMRVGLVSGQLDKVAAAYANAVSKSEHPLLATYLRLKLAHLYGSVLDSPDQAVEVYGDILQTQPTHTEARRRLRKLADRTQNPKAEALLLESEVAEHGPNTETLPQLEELLALYTDRLDDQAAAVEASRRILEVDSTHEGALETVGPSTGELENAVFGDGIDADSIEADAIEADAIEAEEALDAEVVASGELPAAPPEPPNASVPDLMAVTDSAIITGNPENETEFEGSGDGPESETAFSADLLERPSIEVSDVDHLASADVPEVPPPSQPADASLEVDEGSIVAITLDPTTADLMPDVEKMRAESASRLAQQLDDRPVLDPESDPFATDPDSSKARVLQARPSIGDEEEVVDAVVPEAAAFDSAPETTVDSEPAMELSAPVQVEAPENAPLAGLLQEARESGAMPLAAVLNDAERALAQQAADHDPLEERREEIETELATSTDDVERSAELLEELAGLAESTDAHEHAFDALLRLARLEPTAERLERLLLKAPEADRLETAVEAVNELAPTVGGRDEVLLGLELARIEREELDSPQDALQRLERLYERSPGEEVLGHWLSALDGLQQPEKMAEVLEQVSAEEPDSATAGRLIERASTIREDALGDLVGAAETLQIHLQRFPEHDELRDRAAELFEKAERWEDLAEVLVQAVARREEAERAALRIRLFRVQYDRLKTVEQAERTLREGLGERAREPALLEALAELLEGDSRWDELFDVLLARVDVVRSSGLRLSLRRTAAQLAEEKLDRADFALDVLAAIRAEEPDDLQTLLDVERIRRALGDVEGVADVLRARTDADVPVEARVGAWTKLADLELEHFGDLDAASVALQQALQLEPHDRDALLSAADVEERRGDINAALDVLDRLSEVEDPEVKCSVHLRRGRLFHARMNDVEGARQEFEAAHQAHPASLEAAVALLDLLQAEGDWVAAQVVAERAAELEVDGRGRAELWAHAGHIARNELADEPKALGCFERALVEDPDDLQTQAVVGQIYWARHDAQSALPHLLSAAEGLSDPELATELFLAAGLAADNLEDEAAARLAYDRVLERLPTERQALDRLGQLAEKAEEWDRVYELGAHLILHHEADLGASQRATVYARMAEAKLAQEESRAAIRLATKAHRLDERRVSLMQLLARAHEAYGDAFEAAEWLKRAAPLLESDPERRDALMRAGLLLREADDLARAASMLAEAQSVAPQDIDVARVLAELRFALGDARGSGDAWVVVAETREGREQANLLMQGARPLLGVRSERQRARELLQRAVDLVPTHREAWAALATRLEFEGEVKERAKIAERTAEAFHADPATQQDAPGGDRASAALLRWREAYELNRDRAQDPQAALRNLKRIMENSANPEALRDAYVRQVEAVLRAHPEEADHLTWEAIASWAVLVERDPGFVEALLRLRDLRRSVGEDGLARVAEELLVALGEMPMNGAAAPKLPDRAQPGTLPVDESESTKLQYMLQTLGVSLWTAFADELPYARPKKREAVGPAGLGIEISRSLGFAAEALGLEQPQVFLRDELAEAIAPTVCGTTPAVVMNLARAHECGEAELRFLVGWTLASLRPTAIGLVNRPLPDLLDTLEIFSGGAPELAGPRLKQVRRWAKALERAIPSESRAAASEAVATWLASTDRPSLLDQRQAVLRTAGRAGLVSSGSLLATLSGLERVYQGRPPRALRVPLLRYAASREYAERVRKLGLA